MTKGDEGTMTLPHFRNFVVMSTAAMMSTLMTPMLTAIVVMMLLTTMMPVTTLMLHLSPFLLLNIILIMLPVILVNNVLGQRLLLLRPGQQLFEKRLLGKKALVSPALQAPGLLQSLFNALKPLQYAQRGVLNERLVAEVPLHPAGGWVELGAGQRLAQVQKTAQGHG
jgi:hypothetical protein